MAFDSTSYYYKPSLETCPEEEDEESHGSDQECDASANDLLVDLLLQQQQQQQHYQWAKVIMGGFCDPFKKMKRHPTSSCSPKRRIQQQQQLPPQSNLSPPSSTAAPLLLVMPITETENETDTTTSPSCDSDSISEASENETTAMVVTDSPNKEENEGASKQDTPNEKEPPRAEDTSIAKLSHGGTTSPTSVAEEIESVLEDHRITEKTDAIIMKNLDANFHHHHDEGKVLHLTMSFQFCLAIALLVIFFNCYKFTFYHAQPKKAAEDILVLSAGVELVEDALLLQEVIVFSKEQIVLPTRPTREFHAVRQEEDENMEEQEVSDLYKEEEFHAVRQEECETMEEQEVSNPCKEEEKILPLHFSTIQLSPLGPASSETKDEHNVRKNADIDRKDENSKEHVASYPLESPIGDLKEEHVLLTTTTTSKDDEHVAASVTRFTRHLLFVSKRRSYVPVQVPSLKNKKGWQPLNYVQNRISNFQGGGKNWISTCFAKWLLVPLPTTTTALFQKIINDVQKLLRISKNWLLHQVGGVLKQRGNSFSK